MRSNKKSKGLSGMGKVAVTTLQPLPTTGRLRSRRNYAITLLTRAAIKAKLSAAGEKSCRCSLSPRGGNLHNTRHCLHFVSPWPFIHNAFVVFFLSVSCVARKSDAPAIQSPPFGLVKECERALQNVRLQKYLYIRAMREWVERARITLGIITHGGR
jgi:hypothetical protein